MAWADAGFRTMGQIVWHKSYASGGRYVSYRHESAYILAKGNPPKPAEPLDDVQPWTYTGNRNHPTEKAVEILAPLVRSFSRKGDLVIDPFAGSGSTAVAAALNGRNSISIELEECYCAIARQRLEGVRRHLGLQDALHTPEVTRPVETADAWGA
jgi:site-specific DNA-methyltransferase (adenine-specific)